MKEIDSTEIVVVVVVAQQICTIDTKMPLVEAGHVTRSHDQWKEIKNEINMLHDRVSPNPGK